MIYQARYGVGQLVHHRLFDYRGVVVDVDPVFQGTEEWYRQVARSRPPRDLPWYHVLVHGSDARTYVAERNLEQDTVGGPVDHEGLGEFFAGFRGDAYTSRRGIN